MKSSQQFWIKRYLDKATVTEWYNNYKTFYSVQPSEAVMKKEFLEGERIQIEETFRNRRAKIKVYNFLREVVNQI